MLQTAPNTGIQLALLLIAGSLSLLMSCFGLHAWLWNPTRPIDSFDFVLFWLLPLLALPLFFLRAVQPRTTISAFWLLALCQFLVISWTGWTDCLKQRCTITDVHLIVSAGLSYPPVWGWLLIAGVLETERRTSMRTASGVSE